MSWIECVVDSDYEIFTEFPYNIRRKSNKRKCSEWINHDGYYELKLNGTPYRKHKIIALQFIKNENPEINTVIDHIDKKKTNNHISNLRWVSQAENNRNKSTFNKYEYEYVENISDDCIIVDTYNKSILENYYYDEKLDVFYYFNGVAYRKLKINYTKYNKAFVSAIDTNNKKIKIYYSSFKKQYDLL